MTSPSRGSDSSTRTRTADDSLFRQLDCRYSLLAAYRRELLQKLIQRITRLEIVEQVIDRNARSDEYQLAAHDLGVAVDDLLLDGHRTSVLPLHRQHLLLIQ